MELFDPDKTATIEAALDDLGLARAAASRDATFGCPSDTADSTQFAVLVTGGIAHPRLPGADRDELAAAHGTRHCRAAGRRSHAWPTVTLEEPSTVRALDAVLRASSETAIPE